MVQNEIKTVFHGTKLADGIPKFPELSERGISHGESWLQQHVRSWNTTVAIPMRHHRDDDREKDSRKGLVDGAGTLSKVASLGGRERVTGGGGRAQTERTRAWRNHPSRSAPGWKTKTHRGGMLLGRSLLCQLQSGIRWRLRTSVLWAGCLTRCGKGSSRRTAIRTTRSPSRRPAGSSDRSRRTSVGT